MGSTLHKGGAIMTKEQATEWLDQYSDEEVHIIFAALLRMRRTGQLVKTPQESDLKG